MKKTILTTFICSVIVVGVALAGYVVYDKLLKDNELNNNDTNESTSVWINYLTNQELELTKSVWDYDAEECKFEKVDISKSDLTKALTKLSTKKITKYYYGSMPPTGTLCSNRYEIKYQGYSIKLEDGGIMWNTDEILSSKLDIEVTDVNKHETFNEQNNSYVYKFDIDFENIFKDYSTIKNEKTHFNSNILTETKYTFKYDKKLTAIAYGDVSKYSNIFEYFSDMKLEGIKIEYPTKEVKEGTMADVIYHRDNYALTEDEIKNFLEEMKTSKQKLTGGFGLDLNPTYIIITYKINGKSQTTKLMDGMWMLNQTTDGNIYKILDNNMPESEWDVLLIADKKSNTLSTIYNRLTNK